tara:strand:- start:207 stop:380 length:174 start_codon:yes stop_codon:yes gene_type:complete
MTRKEQINILVDIVSMNNQLLGLICKHLFGEPDKPIKIPKEMQELIDKFKFEDWGEG